MDTNIIEVYTVEGMSCSGCKTSVESVLKTIPQIDSFVVDLKEKEAALTMSELLSDEKLQQIFTEAGLHYTIKKKTVITSLHQKK